jgi:pentatricopeptide repeat protein
MIRRFTTQTRQISLKDARKAGNLRLVKTSELGEIQPVKDRKEFLYQKGKFNPVYAFENSLKIGTVKEIYSIYSNVKASNSLGQISENDYKKLLKRISLGHFGYLGAEQAAKFALHLREDFVKSGRVPDIEFEASVVKSFQFVTIDKLPQIVVFIRNVIEQNKGLKAEGLMPLYNAFFCLLTKLKCFEVADAMLEIFAHKEMKLDEFYLALCDAHSANGNMEKAQEMYSKAILSGSDNTSLLKCALIKGYAAKGDISMTRKLFNQITENQYGSVKHSALIKCHAQRGLPAEALKAYKQMRLLGIETKPQVYEDMIRANGNDSTAANRWFYKTEGISHMNPSMGMYGALIESFLNNGDSLTAWKLLKASLNALKESKSKSSQIALPECIILPLAKDLVGKDCEYLGDRIKFAPIAPSLRPEVLTKLMGAALLESVNEPDLTLMLYNEFTANKGCCTANHPGYVAHLYAMQAYVLKKDLDSALKLFNRVIDSSFDHEIASFDALLTGYAISKDQRGFNTLYNEFKNQKLQPTVFTFEAILSFTPKNEWPRIAKEIQDLGIITNKKLSPLVFECLKDNLIPPGLLYE